MLITAGPTQEPLDPVRYLSNRSSGKMGYALAEDAAARGARVILVSGPVTLAAAGRSTGIELIHVQTAVEMRQAVMDHLEQATMIIKAAAVADYHRDQPAAAESQENRGRLVARARSDAGYPGGRSAARKATGCWSASRPKPRT